ncbi:hypothetical protein P8452_65375 [Trifolium repens]|nr:hypothetical protein P8452_08383 [Trifolium repens]WJX20987.1 hypothetical protein P8452_10466 [Trifolium repens]WJX29836.1 hypothetical protein P8452_18438 [Trifolium repens]WJX50696.1 hypothetical protein P8452_36962 [Trifolium repens]WJX63297.1 hypothetical protein P8452_48203 [Trifolium repens]
MHLLSATTYCHVMHYKNPLEPIHSAFHFECSLFHQSMSRAQQGLSKNSASLLDAGLPVPTKGVDDRCQASEPRMVDPSVPPHVPPHVHQPVDDFLTAIQTYYLEFDVENLVGRLPACFVREFGKDVSEYVILRDPNHNEFEVQVVKKVNEIYFGDGWHSLKDAYDIKFNALRYTLRCLGFALARIW